MTFDLFSSGWPAILLNHLWQSTAVALLAFLLTLALRNNAARVRYGIWLLASIKFLLPFQLLSSLGTHLARPVSIHDAQLYTIIEEFTRPVRQAPIAPAQTVSAASYVHHFSTLVTVLFAVWFLGFAVLLFKWISGWLSASSAVSTAKEISQGDEFDALLQAERRAGVQSRIKLLLSSPGMEPGIFGIFRPVLLWPAGLSRRLDRAQIEAIMAHEIEHVRRRDNLTFAIHSFVEAIFWFHPFVRWMTARLSEERERACDERVLEQSSQPEAYAQGILKVCSFCIEPSAVCVSGVSGADLKQRIFRIMSQRSGRAMSFGRKCMLFAAAIILVIAPLEYGVLHGQSFVGQAEGGNPTPDIPKYEVATVKPSTDQDGRIRMMMTPDGAEFNGVQVQMLLQQAFGVERDRIDGAPDWVRSKRFDIAAKVSPEDAPKLDKLKMEQRRTMLLPLLEERFGLKYHHETRELPMYTLLIAKGGPKLKVSTAPPPPPPGAPGAPGGPAAPDGPAHPAGLSRQGPGPGGPGMMRMSPGEIDANGGGMPFLAHALSALVGRSVVDKTGLTGNYDFNLKWTPDESTMPRMAPGAGGPPPQADSSIDPNGPTLFTALEEQLGLKLQSEKGKVDVIVIDHIDLPTEN
ncbi:M56 family metallopeptidase [Occallatibacter savannae]|uniref:M56 family metallopeptidase n=1 Tax=Occallatibacter savannae TaxID=1002691 RepID=UPI000D68727E|nr:M56 family metallopeptidase [Occallatibacter savannae]